MPLLASRVTALFLTVLSLLAGLLSPAAKAACPQRPAHAVIAAEEVFEQLAERSPNLRRTELSVACLNAVPTPAQSATIYGANAIIQLQIGDEPGALLWLRAMIEADAAAQLSPTLAPPDHPLFALEVEARVLPPSAWGAAPIPRRHTLWVDGVEAMSVPSERPALVALTNERGEVVWSDLVAPGADLRDEWRGVQVSSRVYAALGITAGLVVGYAAVLFVPLFTGMPPGAY